VERYESILYVAADSDFTLAAAAAQLRTWAGPSPFADGSDPFPPPDLVELVGADELRVSFAGWGIRIRWQDGRRGRVASVVGDPIPKPRPKRRRKESDDDREPDYDILYSGTVSRLVEQFRGVCAHHPDMIGEYAWEWRQQAAENQPPPVPTHLRDWMTRVEVDKDSRYAEGALRCPCGGERLEVYYPGQTHVPGGFPCTVELDGERTWFGVQVACTACGRKCLVFDSWRHGYEAFPRQSTSETPPHGPVVPWPCSECASIVHHGTVHFRYDSPQRFLGDNEGAYDLARRPDAFTWFGMNLKCCRCGDEPDREWAGYETA
jgi:hypothetical protein